MPVLTLRDVAPGYVAMPPTNLVPIPEAEKPAPAPTPTANTPVTTAQSAGAFFDASCREEVLVLAMVRASTGTRVATATAATSNPVIGIVIAKPTPTTCRVQRYGYVSGFTDLIAGAAYFLGLDGAIYAAPIDPQLPYVHRIGSAVMTRTLYLSPTQTAYKRDLSGD